MRMTTDALVLAGGGVAGISWEVGVLFGLQEADPPLAAAILADSTALIGTSAGSAVGSQVASGLPLSELFESQLREETSEIGAFVDFDNLWAAMAAAAKDASSPEEARRRLGAVALAAETVPAETRRAVIAARLPVQEWPQRRLLITAVDADTGEFVVFDRDSGVDLVSAVGASCAVPGVWPAVEIDGRRFMDGGMRTLANADLAAGAERVLILVPGPERFPSGPALPAAELDALAPARVHTLFADAASLEAFGTNPLDPTVRRASALAGREVGRDAAAGVAAFWSRGAGIRA